MDTEEPTDVHTMHNHVIPVLLHHVLRASSQGAVSGSGLPAYMYMVFINAHSTAEIYNRYPKFHFFYLFFA